MNSRTPRLAPLNVSFCIVALIAALSIACAGDGLGTSKATATERSAAEVETLRQQAATIFGALPSQVTNPANKLNDAKIDLGRQLYYDKRLSKNHDIACNSCHLLDNIGQDSEPTSPGHRGQRGGRNSPTVYNAAGHIAQFWDGRSPDLEAQAQGPILNPIEMAMPSEAAVLTVLKSIPGYVEQFPEAFPNDQPALTYANMARAIGAFERRLMTPGRFDVFVEGDASALSPAELDGLETFIQTGCPTCHMGSTFGGTMYQKLGAMKPYPTEDPGRFDVTGKESDRQVFKVPSLRNIAETGPYFHDGGITSLDRAVSIMAEYQLGKQLSEEQNASIRTFLQALTGEVDTAYIAMPVLPPSGPTTPAPNPN